MGGGGKSSTSTQTVSIPPEVLARYNAVNARAESVAQQPFQQYGGEFVAPLTPTQTAGIEATSKASQLAQPYYGAATQGLLGAQQGGANYIGAATGAALAGAAPVSPQGLEVGRYMNPFTQSVVGATQAALGQQQGQQLAQQQAEAIRSGAYGGDRAGLQRQALRGQQSLAQAQAIAPLYQQGYQQALQTAQQQQGVGLGAEQANRQAIQQLSQQLAGLGQQGFAMGSGAAQQLAGLGTGAQQAALQGAQAQIGAGTLQQQTQQAQDTAQYQQFLQQRGYDFQVAQFLANIAMGTGALSGSTTSTTQPRGFFSNRGGFKTGESLHRSGKAYGGGLDPNSMGGAVYEPGAFERGGYATSGAVVDSNDLAAILAQQRQSFGPFAAAGPYGQAAGATPHGPSGIVPQQQLATPKLVTAGALPKQQAGAGSDLGKVYSLADEATKGLTGKGVTQRIGEKAFGKDATGAVKDESGNILKAAQPAEKGFVQEGWDKLFGATPAATGGGIMPRHHYADGGSEDSQADEAIPHDPSDVMSGKDPIEGVLKAGSQKPQMLKPASGGGGGGGSGKLGLGKAAGSMIGTAIGGPIGGTLGSMVGSSLPFNEGGIVPRHGYQTAGTVEDLPIDAEIVERAPGLNPNVVSELKREEQRQAAIPQEVKGLVAARPQEEPQIDYRGMVESAAKQKGLDVGHATRLVQGESGFKPIAGDEGSSASLWQLHVGGLSQKYPNAGLGDDYFSQRHPELAKSFTPAQKIAYLNDPRNQQDITDFATDYIAKNGAKPWTVARNQGLFGLSGQGVGAPRPPADVGRSAEGKPQELGFFDRNKGIILPVLQGLGAMASSKSISPFAAALQGLGAGAKAYGDVEQQQATTAQIQEQTARLKQVQLSGDIIETAAGPIVLLPGGKKMRQGDWIRAGMPLTLSQTRYGTEAAGASTPSGAELGAVGGQTTQAQKYLESVLSPNLPNYQRLAEENALTASSDKLENLAKQGEEFNPFLGASERAKAARLSYDPTRNLAEALSRYPEGGPVTANVIQPVIDRLDDLFKRAGIAVPAIDERASASDVIDKYRTQMGAAAQAAGGSKAYAELQTLMSAIPSKIQSKSGQADLVAAMILANQTPKDEDAALRAYRQYVEQKHGLTPGQSQYAGRGVAQEIESAMQPRISQEKQIIKSMFMNGIKDSNGQDVPIITSVDGAKKPGTLLSYLYQNAGTIPDPKIAEFLYRNYGKDNVNRMLRIFRGGQ
jgi:hypothetical protein